MSYSPMSFTTATSGRAGFVRLGSGIGGNSDGTIVSNATLLGLTKSSVGLGNVENTALSTWAGSSNITTVGTLSSPSFSGIVNFTGNTASTNTTTGALVVTGGAGVGGQLTVNSTVQIYDPAGTLIIGNSSAGPASPTIVLGRGSTGDRALISSNYGTVYNGTTNLRLFNNNAGTHFDLASYTSNNQWGHTEQGFRLRIEGSNGDIQVLNTTSAFSTSTGALQVLGGASVQGALYVGNQLVIDNSRRNAANDGNLYSPDAIIIKDYYGTGNTIFNMNNSGGGMNLKTSNTSTKLYIGCDFSFGSQMTFSHGAVVLEDNKSFFVNNIVQKYTLPTIVSNAVTLDLATSNKFRLSSSSGGNIRLDFINAPQTVGVSYLNVLTWEVIIDQGNPTYFPSTATVNGSSATIKWENGTNPAPTINRTSIITFTVIYNGTYILHGRHVSYA